jgi:hypothetical protein
MGFKPVESLSAKEARRTQQGEAGTGQKGKIGRRSKRGAD